MSTDLLSLQHFNVQRKTCLSHVTSAYKLKEKISSTVFKCGE